MQKLILTNYLSPGDIVMLTAAVRDLHRCYPGEFITDVRTSCPELWENNPYLTPLQEGDPEVKVLPCGYPLIERSNIAPYHCVHGFSEFLNDTLDLQIRATEFKGDIHISDLEKSRFSRVREVTGAEIPYWIVVAGGKFDVTLKWWKTERYQAVVNHFRGKIQFVQVGEAGHHHPRLENVIDLRGKTDLRDLVLLVHHAQGVLCGITAMMHLAAAVPAKKGCPNHRACVVVAGGREPPHWVEYPRHQFIHTVGQLKCCEKGGCWRARTVPLGDGDERDRPDQLCVDVVENLPRCMHMISPEEVAGRISGYFAGGALQYLTPEQAEAAVKGVERTTSNTFVSEGPRRRGRTGSLRRSVILQQASGRCLQMLDVSNAAHAAYADRHGFAFWSVRGDLQFDRHPAWNKLVLIHMALAAGFDYLVWLDADTLIINPEEDLRDALPDGPPIGMCIRYGGWGDPAWHFNSGVIFARNASETREFFTKVWNSWPVEHHWHEQVPINEHGRAQKGLVQTVDHRWNCNQDFPASTHPVVLAWHGEGESALPLMRETLATLQAHRTQKNGSDHSLQLSAGIRSAAPANT